MNLYTYPVQSKDVQFDQTETTMVTAALTMRAQAKNKWALSVGGDSGSAGSGDGTGGDSVTLSDEAKALAAASSTSAASTASAGQQAERATVDTGLAASTKTGEDESTSAADQVKDKIQKRIKELQQEIQKVQSDTTLTEDQRRKRIQELQTELMSLMNELQKQSSGHEYTGGTVAEGMGSSLT